MEMPMDRDILEDVSNLVLSVKENSQGVNPRVLNAQLHLAKEPQINSMGSM